MTLTDIERLEALAEKAERFKSWPTPDRSSYGTCNKAKVEYIAACDPLTMRALCALARRGLASPGGEAEEEWVTVPREATAEMVAAAAVAVWPTNISDADMDLARKAARIILISGQMELAPGATIDSTAAGISTMAVAYRQLIANAPAASPSAGMTVTDEMVQAAYEAWELCPNISKLAGMRAAIEAALAAAPRGEGK